MESILQFIAEIHSHIMDVDRIAYLVSAICLTMIAGMITGPLAGNANSFLWGVCDALFGRFGDRMDRVTRARPDLMFRGFLYTVTILFFALFLGHISSWINASFIEVTLVSLCLTSGSVWYIIIKLYFALDQYGSVEGAYYGLSRSSRVDLNGTDDYGITRTGLTYAAVSFDKGLIAPSIWYLIGGLPVMLVYSALSFTAWRYGKSGFTKGFGVVPLALEKIMGFFPSLFAGFLFSAASAITPSAKLHQAVLSWWGRKGRAPYEQGGIVLSAIAWPLDVSLGGPIQDISGSNLRNVWVGPDGATAQLNHKHLQRGIFINVIAHTLFILALLLGYIYG
ncbi:MAG: adenosylcobinamide-phosphate synthase [Zetaproteobacteria bacterium]|nr:MAG: adenosylcobinamide-phosphate synthase [Zetaproteobacteria bacterium]